MEKTKTNESSGAAITPVGATSATWCSAAPYRYEFNYAGLGNSQSPAALVAVTGEQCVKPTSVANDAGWAARKKGDGEDASFRGSALPAPSICRGGGLRRRDQENVASAAGPGQDRNGGIKEENSWAGLTSIRSSSSCSAGVPGRGDDRRAASQASGSRQAELGWIRHQGAGHAGVGPVPAPRFLLTGERLPLRRPHSSPPPLRPGSPIGRKDCEKASNAQKPAAKPNELAPLAPARNSSAPTDVTWMYGRPWPPEEPGPGSPAGFVRAAPRDTNTAIGMPGVQLPPKIPLKPETAAIPQSSDLHKPLGVALPKSTHPTAAAETSKGEGLSSACPVMSDANVADGSEVKVDPSVSLSMTGDMHWKCFWWVYQDNKGNVQGPFPAAQMDEWFAAGFLSMELQLKRVCDGSFNTLGTLIETWNCLPFAPGVCVTMPPQP